MAVDPVAVQAALTAWALAYCHAQAAAERTPLPRNERRQVLAVDGKSLRGARRPDRQQTQLLGVIDHAHPLVLTPTEVVDGNEIAAFATALDAVTAANIAGWFAHAGHLTRQAT